MMAISQIVLLLINVFVVFILAAFIQWMLTGRAEHSLEISGLLLTSIALTLISVVVYEDNKILAYAAIAMAGIVYIFIGWRFRVHFEKPVNHLNREHDRILKENDLSVPINMELSGKSKGISGVYETENQIFQFFKNTVDQVKQFSLSSRQTIDEVSQLISQYDAEASAITSGIDEILQNAIVIDEVSQELRTIISNLSILFETKQKVLYKSISDADVIADQSNLIAVNAAIEAAQAKDKDNTFSIVADSIQKLSSRSRDNTEKMEVEAMTLFKNLKTRLDVLSISLNRLDDTNLQIMEKTDNISIKAHTHNEHTRTCSHNLQDLVNNINTLMESMNKIKT